MKLSSIGGHPSNIFIGWCDADSSLTVPRFYDYRKSWHPHRTSSLSWVSCQDNLQAGNRQVIFIDNQRCRGINFMGADLRKYIQRMSPCTNNEDGIETECTGSTQVMSPGVYRELCQHWIVDRPSWRIGLWYTTDVQQRVRERQPSCIASIDGTSVCGFSTPRSRQKYVH